MRFGPKLVAALIILPAVLTQTAANNKVGPCLESLIISGFFTSGGIIQPTPCCSLWIATQKLPRFRHQQSTSGCSSYRDDCDGVNPVHSV
jgi:hypothetical protein